MDDIIKQILNTILPLINQGITYFFTEIINWYYFLSVVGLSLYIIEWSPWSNSKFLYSKDFKKRTIKKRLVVFYIGTFCALISNIVLLIKIKHLTLNIFYYNFFLVITFILANIFYIFMFKPILRKLGVTKQKSVEVE